MKILLYTHFFKPETGAAVTRINYFYEILKERFKDIKVITPKPNYPYGKLLENFESDLPDDYKENVKYLPIHLPKSQNLVSRMFSYISYFISSLIYSLMYIKKTDFVITSSPPIITAFGAMIVSKIKRSYFILDIRDIWPDIGIELDIIKNSYSIKGLKWIEKIILEAADAIIVTAEGDKLNIINKNISSQKISIIYNGADTKIFAPKTDKEKEDIKILHKIPTDKKILVYFGSFNYGMNDIDLLSETLLEIYKKRTDFFFIAIGEGTNTEKFFSKIKGKINYLHFPSLTNSEVAKIVSSCDISLIPRKKIKKDTGGNIPVKCFESWAAGIPVVMSSIEDSEAIDIFNQCDGGKLVEPGDYKIFAEAVLEMMSKKNLKEKGIRGRRLIEEKFDRYEESKKLIDILSKCLP